LFTCAAAQKIASKWQGIIRKGPEDCYFVAMKSITELWWIR